MNLSTALAPARLALRQFTSNILRATDGRDVLLNTPDGWEVEQPWLWWAGPAAAGTAGPFGHPIPGAYGWDAYTSIPAVAEATRKIVDTLAALPWHVYRDEIERLDTPNWLLDPQALRLDGRVVGTAVDDSRLSRVDYWGQWILSALWYGDGFAYVPMRNSDGSPRPPLYLLNPADVDIRDGSYWVADTRLDGSEIIHLRQPPLVDGRGSGVLARFQSDFAATLAQREYAAGAFSAGVPAGYLKTSTPNISQDQADSLKARWLAQHGNTRRSIAVLNASTEFHPLTWSPVDLAAVDFARISLGQIALIFGIPAYLLGAPTDSNTYANVENRMLELYQLTLLPWIARIEAVLDAQLPAGTEVKLEIDGLLRADIKTRTESLNIMHNAGVITTNEWRRLEDFPPLPEEAVA